MMIRLGLVWPWGSTHPPTTQHDTGEEGSGNGTATLTPAAEEEEDVMASIIQKQKELEEAKARAAQKLNQVRLFLIDRLICAVCKRRGLCCRSTWAVLAFLWVWVLPVEPTTKDEDGAAFRRDMMAFRRYYCLTHRKIPI